MEKIKIGYKDYQIKYLDPKQVLFENGTELIGKIDYNENVIYLSNRYNRDTRNEGLIHEVIHGIDDMYGIGLTEDEVNALGKGIYTVLKDNKLLK
ncbi:hypothetical protein ACLGL1_04560 [Peptococcus simiae]|uniref:hypothetical protein n=1 Tax=Peptococcus simiae TaxID=1643805 RepID=UPI0039802789